MNLKLKRLLWSCVGIVLASTAVIQAADDASAKTFLWKVTSDSGAYVYLLGSVHIATKELYPLPKSIEDAFADSKYLVVEVDESKADPDTIQKVLVEKGVYPAGDSVTKHLSKDGLKTVQDYFEKAGGLGTLEQMKPWLLAVQITAGELQKLGLNPKHGVDKHFLSEAQEKKKTVLELESIEFQLGALSGFSDELQEKFLLSSILEAGNLKDSFNQILDAWKKGDADGMSKLLFKQLTDHPELKPVFEKLFYERNIGMTDKIEEYLKTKEPHFVVMGSGHLVGDKGILKLLSDKKYKIEQIGKSPK